MLNTDIGQKAYFVRVFFFLFGSDWNHPKLLYFASGLCRATFSVDEIKSTLTDDKAESTDWNDFNCDLDSCFLDAGCLVSKNGHMRMGPRKTRARTRQ